MNYLYTFLALDLARERAAEAAQYRRARLSTSVSPPRPALPVRALVTGLAIVSRASAAAVRRLDERRADDLGRALAGGK